MKKFLTLVVLAMGINMAQAATLELVTYYPPGGSADLQGSALAAELQKLGVNHKKVFVKSCRDAIDYVNNNENSLMLSMTGDFLSTDSPRCPGRDRLPGISLFSTLADAPIYFCASPHLKDTSLADLGSSGKTYTVAVPVAQVSRAFYLYERNQKNPIKMTIVPYKGAGDVRTAVLAGNVDLFTAGAITPFLKAGAKCLAASSKSNAANLPSYAELSTAKNFVDVTLITEMWHVKPLSTEIETAVKKVLVSESFKSRLSDLQVIHAGIGSGVTRESLLQKIQAVEVFLNGIPDNK